MLQWLAQAAELMAGAQCCITMPSWAAQYITSLLLTLMLKGVLFSFLSYHVFIFYAIHRQRLSCPVFFAAEAPPEAACAMPMAIIVDDRLDVSSHTLPLQPAALVITCLVVLCVVSPSFKIVALAVQVSIARDCMHVL